MTPIHPLARFKTTNQVRKPLAFVLVFVKMLQMGPELSDACVYSCNETLRRRVRCFGHRIPCHAWNATGHKAIALIAYQHLSPSTRSRVDKLLVQHPDYPRWVQGVAAQNRGRAAFLAASVWADTIKGDPRFHDDNRRATPNIPGLPAGSQARHADWHYMNLPFSTDGTPTRPSEMPNVLTKLQEFEQLASMPDSMKVYVLPWLIHLIGDFHQPLHTMARFDRLRSIGDRGGNGVLLKSGNLHSYWDSRLGASETDRFLDQLAATILRRHPKSSSLEMKPERWAKEGFDLRNQVYGFTGDGTARSPAILSDAYSVNARETAFARAAFAGYRLAEFLNQRLK